ncbi:hypothetical protein D8674_038945 [Pyrus ussuriensis x Pyrus communis]|uniref:Pentatricopeptide repeat-containing protein n=1 Tax=Pyrus ussuriensis x Pyrus communis TaxID=2448454 RepID=A0A5N5FPC8_9ROSA|nr:hypothetical protein D8674_038945 [Pyrus ussuriensis x Pyrus communis]
MHGQAEEALRLFSKTIQKGMDLNDVSFVGVLHACSHIGSTTVGRHSDGEKDNDGSRGERTPGWMVHEFVAGDETRPQAQEIVQMWEKLLEKMKLCA